MSLVLKIAATTLAVWVAVQLVDGLDFTGDWVALLAVAIILAAVNTFIRPIVTFFSLPFVLLTLGLFLLVVNALMLGLTIWISDALDLGLTATGSGAVFLGALVITVVSWAADAIAERVV
jgi:putative membrane protein